MPECVRCANDESSIWRIIKCPMCFKHVCENCAVRVYGRFFCSNQCATNFFILEPE